MKIYESSKGEHVLYRAVNLDKVTAVSLMDYKTNVGQIVFHLYLYFSENDYLLMKFYKVEDATNEYNKILTMMKEN